MRTVLRNQRGVSLVSVGIMMAALTGLAVLGVDVARVALTANEVQTLADVSASAGARALVDGQAAAPAARQVASQNKVDGKNGAIDPPGSIQVGNYANGTFTLNGTPTNAVRANAEATVNNFFAAIFGAQYATSRVQKQATATFVLTNRAKPTLPIALGGCHFPDGCTTQSCLPQLIAVPSTTDNSGWTGLFGGANQQNILNLIPSPCGGNGAVPFVNVGDSISLTNGQITPLFTAVQCMVCTMNQNEFIVPVVAECANNFNQNSVVTGFATITVDHFHFSNNKTGLCNVKGGTVDGIVIDTLFRSDTPRDSGGTTGGGSCTGCGTGYITLVQ
jgi:hypothetical protein